MFDDISRRGMVLLGCGKMGSAMLAGWLGRGLAPASVWVMDPNPSDWVRGTGVHVNADLPDNPAVVLIAVKPQMMGDALPDIAVDPESFQVRIDGEAADSPPAERVSLGQRYMLK